MVLFSTTFSTATQRVTLRFHSSFRRFQFLGGVVIVLLLTFLYIYMRTTSETHLRAVRPSLSLCGSVWDNTLQKYTAFHASSTLARNGTARDESSPKVAMFTCVDSALLIDDCGGIGDRIVGIVSTFLFAVATKRLFFINWPAVEIVFSPASFDWTLPHGWDNATSDLDRRNCGSYWDRGPCWSHPSMYDGFHALSFRINRGVVHEIFTNKEWSPWRLKLEPLGLLPETAFACAFHSLFIPSVQLKTLLRRQSRYSEQVLQKTALSVALHFRFGESGLFEQGTHFDEVVDFRKQSMVRYVDKAGFSLSIPHLKSAYHYGCKFLPQLEQVWLVVSDSITFRTAAKSFSDSLAKHDGYLSRRHRNCDKVTVIIPELNPSHISLYEYASHNITLQRTFSDTLLESVAEWWLLSQCKVHVVDGFSGFSRAAYAISFGTGLHPRGYVLKSILDVGHIYSGI